VSLRVAAWSLGCHAADRCGVKVRKERYTLSNRNGRLGLRNCTVRSTSGRFPPQCDEVIACQTTISRTTMGE
jgi:hypothetical protein